MSIGDIEDIIPNRYTKQIAEKYSEADFEKIENIVLDFLNRDETLEESQTRHQITSNL